MYNKNKNKGVKISLIIAFFAVLIGCVALLLCNPFGVSEAAKNGTAVTGEISAPEKAASSAIVGGEETADGSISAPELKATATAATIYSGTTASDMATNWSSAVAQSSASNQVTFVLEANWEATASGDYMSFGTGVGFYSTGGALDVPGGANIKLDLNGHKIDRKMYDKEFVQFGCVIMVRGTLEVCNSSSTAGQITGGNNDNHYANGGGIAVITPDGSTYANLAVNGNVQIVQNKSYLGGGIGGWYANITMNGGAVIFNTATNGGGGISCITGSVDLKNVVVVDNISDIDGGGVWCSNASFKMEGGYLGDGGDGNVATGNGGGLYFRGGNSYICELSSLRMSDNRADYGGAVYYEGNTELKIYDVEGSATSYSGGGYLYLKSGSATIENCTKSIGGMISNISTSKGSHGGFAYCTTDTTLTIRNCTSVSGSAQYGAFISSSGAVNLTGIKLTGLKGPYSSSIRDYMTCYFIIGGSMVMVTDCEISGCSACAISASSVAMFNSVVSGNSGGGIDINSTSGYFEMYGGEISNNYNKEGYGVASAVDCSGNFTMYGAKISGNYYVQTECPVIRCQGTFKINSGNITDNVGIISVSSLHLNGGSIYNNEGYVHGDSVTISGPAQIYGNTYNGETHNLDIVSTFRVTQSIEGANISVYYSGTGNKVFTSGYNAGNASYPPSAFFKSDKSGYYVSLSSGNEAQLTAGTSSAANIQWRYSTSSTSSGNYKTTTATSVTVKYTGNTYSVAPYYFKNNSYWTEIYNTTKVFTDINGNSISTSQYPKRVGTYTYIVTDGSYSNPTFTLIIEPADVSVIASTPSAQTYTGSALTPSVVRSSYGSADITTSDYTVTYSNNVSTGTATATLKGRSNFTGTATVYFTINPKDLKDTVISLSSDTFTYDGTEKTPTVTVKFGGTGTNKDDILETYRYTVEYSNNINAGTATVTVTGKGNYTGTASKTFTITPLALTNANSAVTLGTNSYTYDGSAKTPAVSSVAAGTLTVPSSQYAVAYSNNVNASTSATVTLTLSGNYSGTLTKTFTITPANLTGANVTFGISNYQYTGSAISPVPTVKLSDKTLAQTVDFTVAYTNNTNAGTSATVTVTGTGNYTGTATGTFTIEKRLIYVAGVSVADKPYDGTKTATVDMSKVKLIGIIEGDKTKLGLSFTAGTEFDGSSVGLHSVAVTGVTLTGDAAGNYELEADVVNGYANIYPATVTITGVAANGKTYDGTTSATFKMDGVTITGALEGEVASLKANLTVNGYFANKNAGDGVAVTVSGYVLGGEYAGNYIVDLANSTTGLTADISKAQVEVTLDKAEYTITYGNALKITYTQNSPVKSESVGVMLEYFDEHGNTKLSGVPTDAGKYRVKVAMDPADVNHGNYTIKLTGEGIISEAPVTIEKATLTVTVEDLEIEYGDEKPADGDYTLIYNGWLNGDKAKFESGEITFIKNIVISTDYEKGADADGYAITLSDGELKNYELEYVDGVLTVSPKKVTVTIDNKTSAYGAAEEELTSDGTEDMGITLERDEGKDVGRYAITGDWDNDNYDITFINGIYEITKAKLTVTAKPKSIVYGDVATNDGVTYTGFATFDGVTETADVLGGTLGYRYTYTQYGNIYEEGTSNAIAYYIIPYGYTSDNYEIEYENGLLTVTKKSATVTVTNAASDITSVPADREVAAQKMKYSVTGTVNGDDLNVTLAIAENGESGAYAVTFPTVGVYKVTGTANNTNYNVTFAYEGGLTYGTYTVSQGTLIITANTLIIGYGDGVAFPADLDEAVTAEGLPAGSTLKDLVQSGTISGTLTVLPYDDDKYAEYSAMGSAYEVGGDIFDESGNRISYVVIPTGLSSASYNIIFKPGKLMIEPKSIVVTLDDKSSVYGDALKELTASAEGLVNYDADENGSVVEFLGITGLAKAEGLDAASYAITATGSDNRNYRVTFAYGVYTIEQYEVTLVWEGGEYVYNGDEQAPVATFEMPDGTVCKSTDTENKYIEVNGGGTNAGDYKAQALLLNPNLKFKAGTDTSQPFSIAQKQLTVTWYADKDDIGDEDKAVQPNTTPIEYEYKTRHPYAPVVVLEGIEEGDESESFYYISGEQSAVSLSPYEAVLHILNPNYCVAEAEMKIFFVIVKSAPDNFAWYEDTDFATQISSLKTYTYNGGVQHPVAKALGDEEFVYTIYKITGETEKIVTSTIDVGSYKIKATPVNGNLELTEAEAIFYFDIVAMEVSVEWSATTFEYNGTEQVPTAYYIDAFGQMVNLTVDGDKGVNANGEDESYSISVTLNSGNYVFIVDGEATDTIETTYTITAKNITVKWKSEYTDEDGKFKWNVVYDNTDQSEVVTATAEMINLVEEVGLKMTVRYQANENDTPVEVSKIHDAGIYTLSIGLAESSPNYNVIDAEQSFTIQKKQLTVSAVSKEVNTGAVAPTLTATYEGFAGKDENEESAESLGLDATKWLTTNYNLNSPYIAESDYTPDADIAELETLKDLRESGYTGYFIVLTDSEARLEELNALLKNYDWSFNYGRMIIIAVNGDISIILTQAYNGEDQLPAAKYKSGDNWIDLKVEVYTDDTYTKKVENPEVKDADEYYVLLKKYSEDGVILNGAETDGALKGCVKKTFTITRREIKINLIDKSIAYGEVTDGNYEDYLNGLWAYASDDKLYQPLAGDELNITISVNLAFDGSGFATVRKDGDVVTGYEVSGSWSDDATLRNNYKVVFEGSDGDKGLLTITNAKITFYDKDGEFNQIVEQNDSMKMALAQMEGSVYKYFSFEGDQTASVEIYYSMPYSLDNNNPDSFPPEQDVTLQNKLLTIAPDFIRTGNDSKYFVNFMIVIANHETYYGQWTAQVLYDTVYIRILFLKEYGITYGESVPDGKTLANVLWNEGYIDKNATGIQNKFQEYINNDIVTAKVVADTDGLLGAGAYTIVFEGLENVSDGKYEVTYKQNVNETGTLTNENKFVVDRRDVTLTWDKTSFIYDGEAHMPTPGIEGWKLINTTVNGTETVYVFENEVSGITLNLTVKTNGGDFTSIGGENIVIAEIEDENYVLDSFNATRAVSIIGEPAPVEPVDPIAPVVQEGGVPAWLVWVIAAAAVIAILVIFVLAIKGRKAKPIADEDGFYEDVDENS